MSETPEGTPDLNAQNPFKGLFDQFLAGGLGASKVEPSAEIRDLAVNFNQFVSAFTDQGFSRKEAISITLDMFTRLGGSGQ